MRGPSAAITSWIVTFVRSALKIGWPFASLPTGVRFLRMKKSGTSAGAARPMRYRSRYDQPFSEANLDGSISDSYSGGLRRNFATGQQRSGASADNVSEYFSA